MFQVRLALNCAGNDVPHRFEKTPRHGSEVMPLHGRLQRTSVPGETRYGKELAAKSHGLIACLPQE